MFWGDSSARRRVAAEAGQAGQVEVGPVLLQPGDRVPDGAAGPLVLPAQLAEDGRLGRTDAGGILQKVRQRLVRGAALITCVGLWLW
jgi:hypothetical protein